MKIWLINPYGTLPGEAWRTYRTTYIAEALVAAGHEVISWISTIEHRSKTIRSTEWKTIHQEPGYTIHLVPSTPYTSHISWARIQFERNFIKNIISSYSHVTDKPDVMLLWDPAVFVSDLIIPFVQTLNCKLVMDVIDLWPELFRVALPRPLQFLFPIVSFPLFYRRKQLYAAADGAIAVTEDYLAVFKKINPSVPTQTVYLGINYKDFQLNTREEGEHTIRGISKDKDEVWIIYAGTLGEHYDIQTMLNVALRLERETDYAFKWLIAGEGPLRSYIIDFIEQQGLKNCNYLGVLSPTELTQLYRHADIAVSSYKSGSTVSMPAKLFDYLAMGLPVVNSLGRALKKLVKEKKIGLQYQSENQEDFYQKLIFLIENSELRKWFAEQAKQIGTEFDVTKQYPQVVEVLKQVQGPIRLLKTSDAGAVAQLHQERFQHFFLSQLGYRFLVRFYALILEQEEGIGVGYVEGRQLKGFAIGSFKLSGFYSRILKKGWWSLGWSALPRLLLRPRLIARLYKSLKHKDDAEDFKKDAVLLSIAVAPQTKEKGVGSQLLQVYEEVLLQNGCARVSLTTDKQANEKAIGFYKKNKYIFVKEIHQGNRPMLVLAKNL